METDTPTPSTPASPATGPLSCLSPIERLSLHDWDDTPGTPTGSHVAFELAASARTSGGQAEYQTSNYRTHLSDFPPEIIGLIVHHLYYSIISKPTEHPSPDPYLRLIPAVSSYLPPTFEATHAEQARETFRNLCLVDTNWGEAGRKVLWRNVGIGMPRAFQSILRTIEEYKTGRRQRRIQRRMASQGGMYDDAGDGNEIGSEESSAWNQIEGMDLEVDAKGSRMDWSDLGTDSPWAELTAAAEGIGGADTPRHNNNLSSLSAPESLDPANSPLLLTKTLSFSRFRTAGLRRSLRQGSNERFVTPQRLLALLRGTRVGQEVLDYPGSREDEEESVSSSVFDDGEEDDGAGIKVVKGKLESVGFTEFMDSAISKGVLDELLFRGGYLAEYEEKEAPVHLDLSDSELVAASFSPLRPNSSRISLNEQAREGRSSTPSAFLARHLQSSHSRSPSPRFLASSLAEESGESTDDSATDNEDNAYKRGERRRRRRGRVDFARPELERRGSGSTFATSRYSEDFDREESQERGRERLGRMEREQTASRGRPRRNRSQVPPSAFATRSSSVPTQYLQRSLSVGDSERSSSVPAAQRRYRGAKKTVRVLEGSKEVRPIRALDLCGCVSQSFIAALESVISTYHLGPPGLFPPPGSTITAIAESSYDSNEDDSGTEGGYAMSDSMSSRWSSASSVGPADEYGARRKLKRIYFPHLRRLGLSSALLPPPLLAAFVLSFPYLTHLDLSSTLAGPVLIKQLAMAGQSGPGGRSLRLTSLSLARCRFMTGEAIVGLLCGDCPPFTSMAGHGEDAEDESWGSGEAVQELLDLSLFGDATHPSPLTLPEFRLILTISPALTSGRLRTIDLSSIPMTDAFLADHFPVLPQLIELGLAGCRGISYKGVAALLLDKAPGVEVLVLSGSCRPLPPPVAPGRRATDSAKLSVMELHVALLGRVASVNPSSNNIHAAAADLKLRRTNLRVVELDDKTLEAMQGGAGDWKVIWGKGRRGWYVDIGTSSVPNHDMYRERPRTLVHLARDDPHRQALQRLVALNGVVSGEMGWHARKMEILRGDGMMGREEGLCAYHAFGV